MGKDIETTEFLFAFKGIIDCYNKTITKVAMMHGLSKPEADILLFFSNNPQYTTAKEAVDYRGFSKGYVSKAVEPLIKKGLMEVTTRENDRRFQQLYVTGEAAKTVEALQQVQKEFFVNMRKDISQEQLQMHQEVMKAFLKNAMNYME